MKWLVAREMWENKGSLLWAPLIVAALIVLFVSFTASYGIFSGQLANGGVVVNGTHVDFVTKFAQMPPDTRASLVRSIASGYLSVAAPLLIVLTGVVFFYCLGALYEERRDRSILFWKSLPISDQATVLSKVATALVVAPVITIFIGIVMSVILLLLGALLLAFKGINLFGLLATTPALYLTPLTVVALLPIYILWALPTVGWLLMVSAWAKSKVFLWAVGVPILLAIVVQWTRFMAPPGLDIRWYLENVLFRGLGGLVPGIWMAADDINVRLLVHAGENTINISGILLESYMLLGRPQIWIGALVGAAMIYAAIKLRRWKDEG